MVAKAASDPAADAKEQAKQHAHKVRDAAAGRVGPGKTYVRSTPHGDVEIGQLAYGEDDTGQAWIDVWTVGDNQAGDPHFRIVNPPLLVVDPAGDIDAGGGRRLREDPLAAVAEAVGSFGGARATRRRR